MEQTRKDMTRILRNVQEIQIWALENGIHSFEVTTRIWRYEDEGGGDEGLIREYGDTEERNVNVSIFRTGDDSEEDYFRVSITQYDSDDMVTNKTNQITNFIGYVSH